MITLPDGREATWLSESGAAEPRALTTADDTMRADVALHLLREGRPLLWTGDFRNARTLLSALKRRLNRAAASTPGVSLAERWRHERESRREVAEVTGQLLVVLEPTGEVSLPGAPQTHVAVEAAWGAGDGPRLVSLNALMGALGAAEWARKGIEVPGLVGNITPAYGVFSPTRSAYVSVVHELDVRRRSVLDVGCGTGVLALSLLQRGARAALGTDLDPRAIECANANARALGMGDRFTAVEADLFPVGERADVVVFNAPWIPEAPRTRLDRTVFDEGGATLKRFISGVSHHLEPRGFAALVLSDLPERLGLRPADEVNELAENAGLTVLEVVDAPASHRRSKDSNDPLHEARAAERVRMWMLGLEGASNPRDAGADPAERP